ncbi:MAG TPA: type II secretion system F family protein, partial [Frankiaceae bacterium]|nr:type II secretion system F family protein [Frankiaceae bacterium]
MATTYAYAVRDRAGKMINGHLEADSPALVATKLKAMGYAPVNITEANAGMKREIQIPGFGNKVKLKDLAIMSRQFATMVNSGLPLLRALRILAEQTESKELSRVLHEVRADVEGGTALSVAMAKFSPKVFPPLMINMARAGEVGGFLDTVLLQVAENYEAEVKLRGKVKSAMTYPVIVFIMAMLMCTAMLLFIVPVFAKMFSSLGGKLPAPTRLLMDASNILKSYFPIFFLMLIVFIVVWKRVKFDDRVRAVVDPLKLKIPVFGNLAKKIALSRFARNLGT